MKVLIFKQIFFIYILLGDFRDILSIFPLMYLLNHTWFLLHLTQLILNINFVNNVTNLANCKMCCFTFFLHCQYCDLDYVESLEHCLLFWIFMDLKKKHNLSYLHWIPLLTSPLQCFSWPKTRSLFNNLEPFGCILTLTFFNLGNIVSNTLHFIRRKSIVIYHIFFLSIHLVFFFFLSFFFPITQS